MEDSDLGVWDKAKVVKNTASAVSKIKSIVQALLAQITSIPEELKAIKEAADSLKTGVSDGSVLEKGLAADKKGLTGILACYEDSYGKLR